MTAQLERVLTSKNRDLPDFLEVLSDFLTLEHLTKRDINQFSLVMDEVINNIFSHGFHDSQSQNSIKITVSLLKNSIKATVIDNGVPFDPTKHPLPDLSATLEERPIGGLGLYLVITIVDFIQYQYKNGYNILKLKKKISTQEDNFNGHSRNH